MPITALKRARCLLKGGEALNETSQPHSQEVDVFALQPWRMHSCQFWGLSVHIQPGSHATGGERRGGSSCAEVSPEHIASHTPSHSYIPFINMLTEYTRQYQETSGKGKDRYHVTVGSASYTYWPACSPVSCWADALSVLGILTAFCAACAAYQYLRG